MQENAHMTLTSEYRQFSADTGRSTSDSNNIFYGMW